MKFFGCLAFLFAVSVAPAYTSQNSYDLSPVYDRFGNGFMVANRFDGDSYCVDIKMIDRRGSLLREHRHCDGYQEIASLVHVADDGNLYITGLRYWQGHKYAWSIKYYPENNRIWDWADDQPDCTASRIETNNEGAAWVASLCHAPNAYNVRLVHLDHRGIVLWNQNYTEGQRGEVEDLSVDFGNRASMTMVIGDSRDPIVRTVVYDNYGRQLTLY